MPTKRRFFIFLIVLVFMLLVKYAAAQETVGWDVVSTWDGDSARDVYGAMMWSVICGLFAGAVRALQRQRAARAGDYFSGDLVMLRISPRLRR